MKNTHLILPPQGARVPSSSLQEDDCKSAMTALPFLQSVTNLSASHLRRLIDHQVFWSQGVCIATANAPLAPSSTIHADLRALDAQGALLPPQVQILYDDAQLIAFNKPASIETLALRKILERELKVTLFPLHRLDAPTSGVLLFAKTQQTKKRLDRAFRERKMIKIYCALCLVENSSNDQESKRAQELLREPRSWFLWEDFLEKKRDLLFGARMKISDGASNDAQHALLRATMLKGSLAQSCALCAFDLHTGRTHQIRAQAAARGLPILGDRQYGLREAPPSFHSLAYAGHFLHASLVQLPSSVLGTTLTIKAPFPLGWSEALRAAKMQSKALDRLCNPSSPPLGRFLGDALEEFLLQSAKNAQKLNKPKASSKEQKNATESVAALVEPSSRRSKSLKAKEGAKKGKSAYEKTRAKAGHKPKKAVEEKSEKKKERRKKGVITLTKHSSSGKPIKKGGKI